MSATFSDLIILLSSGINQRRLYFDAHPRVRSLGQDFAAKLDQRLRESGETSFFFGVLDGKFIRDGRFLVGPSIAGRSLIEFAERLGCGGFLFQQHVTAEEVAAFFRLAAGLRERTGSLDESMAMLRGAGIRLIVLTPHFRQADPNRPRDQLDFSTVDPSLIQFDFTEDDEDGEGGGLGRSIQNDLAPLLPIFQSMYETVAGNHAVVGRDGELDLSRTQSVSEQLQVSADRETMNIMNLMRYPDYDSYTIGHSVRVSTLALTVGREMGWPEHKLGELATAGLLHDLGKAKVPDEILYKPDKLDPDERRIAETHAEIGARLLLARGNVSPLIVAGAWGHHIRHDGGGYPKMPPWAVHSPIAALIQVCDVFEALTAARPYKNPMPPRRAFEFILKDRAAFHPNALMALVRAVGLYPPGSDVVLSDGSRGYVTARGDKWDSPLVRITRDKKGRRLERDDQFLIDLADNRKLEVADFLSVNVDADGKPVAGAPDEAPGGEAKSVDELLSDARI
ncbi:HD-GYP domain-containing protein [bacterium]|nr:HD-GYP domain-containing protein [bacterium]